MQGNKLLKKAINHFGKDNQIEMIIEECSELILALQKYKWYGNTENVHEELAYVNIMLKQANIIFDSDKIKDFERLKFERLEININQNK